MARWGYEKGFVIEHDPTRKKRISCRDCTYYEQSDRSCMKRPLYLPEDGYNSWRNCKFFDLSDSAPNLNEKYGYLLSKQHKEEEKEKKLKEAEEKIKKQSEPKKTDLKSGKSNSKKKPAGQKKLGKYIFMIPVSMISMPEEMKNYKPTPETKKLIRDYYKTHHELDKPIMVKKIGSTYKISDGYSRYYVGKTLGLREIPAILETDEGKERNRLCRKELTVQHRRFGIGTVESYSLLSITIRFPNRDNPVKFDLDLCVELRMLKIL